MLFKIREMLFIPIILLLLGCNSSQDNNIRPIADAGKDQYTVLNEIVYLNGSKSYDENQQSLTYKWKVLSKPLDSKAVLTNTTLSNPTFMPDRLGEYKFQLVVNDSVDNSNISTVTIFVRLAGYTIPNAGEDQNVTLGEVVQLGSINSSWYDEKLDYKWSIISKPEGSELTVSNFSGANPSFTPDKVGLYKFLLDVDDNTSSNIAINVVEVIDPGMNINENILLGIDAKAVRPSKIHLLFQAFDKFGIANENLTKEDFKIVVDGIDITNNTESYASIAPVGYGYSLRSVFLLDISSSISDEDFKTAINGLRHLLISDNNESKLLKGQTVSIVIFDGNTNVHLAFTNSIERISASLEDLENLQRAGRLDNSSTNLYGAVNYALTLWSDSFTYDNIQIGYLVVIGDGEDTSNLLEKHTLVENIKNSKKAVFTVPVGNVSEIGIADLNSLASKRSNAFNKIDFSVLGSELKKIGEEMSNIVNSIYGMEFITSSRSGEENLTLRYSNPSDSSTIYTKYNTDYFAATPRELRINNSNIKNGNLLSNDINVHPHDSSIFSAETKWTNLDGDYNWTILNEFQNKVDFNTSNNMLEIFALENGVVSVEINDTSNIIGAGSITHVHGNFDIYISDITVTSRANLIQAGSKVILTASTIGENEGNFTWNILDNNGLCTSIKKDQFQTEIQTTVQNDINDYISNYTCSILVTDIANNNDRYLYILKVGDEGTNLLYTNTNISHADYDFEDGIQYNTSPFSEWTITNTRDNNLSFNTDKLGEYVISINKNNMLEINSTETEQISFDYNLNSDVISDNFIFYIDGNEVLNQTGGSYISSFETFNSEKLSIGLHTFKWEFTKASSNSPDGMYLDNITFR